MGVLGLCLDEATVDHSDAAPDPTCNGIVYVDEDEDNGKERGDSEDGEDS